VTQIDPQLADPEYGDYRLPVNSPAIGYGCRTFGRLSKSNEPTSELKPQNRPTLLSLVGDRIDVSGPITVDTSWLADTVRVVGDLDLSDQVTLSIAAGVRVEFQGHHRFDIHGCLLALGTSAQPIVMTSSDSDAFTVDTTSLDGAWNGIRFERIAAYNNPSRLAYCVIEYAKSIRDSIMVGPLVLDNYSGVQIVNSVIRHNVGHYGAAVFCFHNASPRLTGCLIYDNSAFVGGSAVYTLDSFPKLVNCTIVHNHDLNPAAPSSAKAILSYFSKPQITSCILWENSTTYELPAQLWEVKPFYTTWSDIEGGWDGEGNFSLIPHFVGGGDYAAIVSREEHIYSLETSSPCINAATPDTSGLLLPTWDIAGAVRVHNGRLDVGAYEGNSFTSVLPSVPSTSYFLPNIPNPFNPQTTIVFAVDYPRKLVVEIFDLSGRKIRTLASRYFEVGKHEIRWNGENNLGHSVASGVYLTQLRDQTIIDSRKIMLIR